MAGPYFMFHRSLQDSRALPFNLELDVSLSLVDGTPLKWNNLGKLTPVSASSDKVDMILAGAASTSSVGSLVSFSPTPQVLNQIGNGYNAQAGPGGNQSVQKLGGFADVIPAQNGMGIWRNTFTPPFSKVVANASGSPTSIILPNSPNTYAANDFRGGTLYCASLNQQVQITASSSVTAGNPLTLTTVAPLGQPGATINADGLTFSATPLGCGLKGFQFSHVVSVSADGFIPSQLGNTSADASGGGLYVWDVDLQNSFVFVIFQ